MNSVEKSVYNVLKNKLNNVDIHVEQTSWNEINITLCESKFCVSKTIELSLLRIDVAYFIDSIITKLVFRLAQERYFKNENVSPSTSKDA